MNHKYDVSHLKYYLSQTGWYLQHFSRILRDPSGYFAYRRFIRKMKTATGAYGMSGTVFRNPCGASSYSSITPHSLSILGINAVKNEEILRMWACYTLQLQIYGKNSRTIQISNNVLYAGEPIMKSWLLGGKSGSWFDNRAHLFLCEINHEKVIISVMSKDKYDFDHIYQIGADLCERVSSGATGEFLQHLIHSRGGYSIYNLTKQQYHEEHNQFSTFIPGSVTKIMTALIALGSKLPMDEWLTVHPIDLQEGSGSTFYPGDKICFHDALYAMMMESSNTLAHVIARSVGYRLK